MSSAPPAVPPWWALRFEALAALDPALVGGVDDRSDAEVSLVENLLDLGGPARVIDVGCGGGRHAVLLAERGHDVTGIDLSPRLLRIARERWESRNPGQRGPHWMPGDMRWLPTCGPADAALLLDGAFGLFEDDADHARVLQSLAERLRPGGKLVLQVPNPYHWSGRPRAQHFGPGTLAEGVDVIRTHRFDAERGRIEEKLVCFKDGVRHEPPASSLRAFTPPELVALLTEAGFSEVELSGTEGWAVPEEALPLHPTDSVWFWIRAST